MPKEGVGMGVKVESKVGPQTQEKALLVCLDNWPRNGSPPPARVQMTTCICEIQQARMFCIQEDPSTMVMDEL